MPTGARDDISLKELVLKIQDYIRHFRNRWKSITAFAIVCAVIAVAVNLNKPKSYTAELTFMLNMDERGLGSGLSSILGQFGFGLGNGETNYDRILKLSKARIITENAVFDSLKLGGHSDFLANHLIAELESINKWGQAGLLGLSSDSLSLEDFRFSHDSVPAFNILENKALKSLHYHLAGNDKQAGLFTSEYDELTGIMRLQLTSSNHDLSIELVNKMFEKLSEYYIQKSTEKQKYEYDILKSKYDSINYVLNSVQLRLANLEDSNKSLFRKIDVLEKNRLKIEQQKLQFIIGKAEEQLQIAKIALDNKTPYIQLIDSPLPPIKPDNKSLVYYILLGLILGCLIAMVFYGSVKLIMDILQQEQ